MTILDANVWIAYIHTKDNQHAKAVKVFSDLQDNIFIPSCVFSEVCTILITKARSKKLADLFVDLVNNNQQVALLFSDDDSFQDLTRFFLSGEHKKLSFVDIQLLFLSQIYTVFTFDKQLKKAITQRR